MGTTNAKQGLESAEDVLHAAMRKFAFSLRQSERSKIEINLFLKEQVQLIEEALTQGRAECGDKRFVDLKGEPQVKSSEKLTEEVNWLIESERRINAAITFLGRCQEISGNKNVLLTEVLDWLPIIPLEEPQRNILMAMQAAKDSCAKNWLIGWGRGKEQDIKVRILDSFYKEYQNAKLPEDRQRALEGFLLEAAKPRSTLFHIKEAKFGETKSIEVFYQALNEDAKRSFQHGAGDLNAFKQGIQALLQQPQEPQSSSWVNLNNGSGS